MVQKARLFKIEQIGKESKIFYIEKDQLLLGRSEDADVFCLHTGISRQHLIVTMNENHLLIEDQGTSNGTKLNEIKIEPFRQVPYRPESTIQLGTCPDIFRITLFSNAESKEHQSRVEETLNPNQALNVSSLRSQSSVLPDPPIETPLTQLRQSDKDESNDIPPALLPQHTDAEDRNRARISLAEELAQRRLENEQQLKELLQTVKEKSKTDYQKIISAAELQSAKILKETELSNAKKKNDIKQAVLTAKAELEMIESKKVQALLELQLMETKLAEEQKKLVSIQIEIKNLKTVITPK